MKRNESNETQKFINWKVAMVSILGIFLFYVFCTFFENIFVSQIRRLYIEYHILKVENKLQSRTMPTAWHPYMAFCVYDKLKTKEHEEENPFTIHKIHTNRLQVERKRLIENHANRSGFGRRREKNTCYMSKRKSTTTSQLGLRKYFMNREHTYTKTKNE